MAAWVTDCTFHFMHSPREASCTTMTPSTIFMVMLTKSLIPKFMLSQDCQWSFKMQVLLFFEVLRFLSLEQRPLMMRLWQLPSLMSCVPPHGHLIPVSLSYVFLPGICITAPSLYVFTLTGVLSAFYSFNLILLLLYLIWHQILHWSESR